MNIVVVGGGTPNRFGNDFVIRAKEEGHTVRVLSHRTNKHSDEIINFLSILDAVSKFNAITEDLLTLDILLYNTSYKGHPEESKDFTSSGALKEKLYLYGFYTNVIIPHRLSIEALKIMHEGSKILFMTTDVIYDRERSENLHKLAYYGGKAYQHQLMLALAACNDKGVSVSSVSPYFNYSNPIEYKKTFEQVYKHIFGKTINGKVFDCWADYA